MYPISSSFVPPTDAGYVPYFYQAGLHQVYPLHPTSGPRDDVNATRPTYTISTVDRPLRGVDQPQTVEQVIANGYFSVPGGDAVTAAISDKQHTSRLGLNDIISQVRRRYEIHQENLHRIELSKCAAMNAIYEHEAYQGPPNSKQTYAKHKAIQDLYEEDRVERTTLWKDVSRLKMQIAESAQLYLSAHRKSAILAEEPGDSP